MKQRLHFYENKYKAYSQILNELQKQPSRRYDVSNFTWAGRHEKQVREIGNSF